MNPHLVRIWLGRILALLLTAKFLDAVSVASYSVRLGGRRTTLEVVSLGITVAIYAYLALALWFRSASVFPIEEKHSDPSVPPTTVRDWLGLAGMILGLFLIASGLVRLATNLAAGHREYSFLERFLPGSNVAVFVNIGAGAIIFVVSNSAVRKTIASIPSSVGAYLRYDPEPDGVNASPESDAPPPRDI